MSLAIAAKLEPLLNPLLPVIDRRISSIYITLQPGLISVSPEEPVRQQFEQLLQHFPATVLGELHRREQAIGPASDPGDLKALGDLPDAADVIDSLWGDPDPDTARWVLWVQGKRSPQRAELLLRQPRAGATNLSNLGLTDFDESSKEPELLRRLLTVPLASGLSPAALFSMVRWGQLKQLEPWAPLFQVGDAADLVAILLEGQCLVWRGSADNGQPIEVARLLPGEPIGDVAYFADHNRRAEVRAEGEPVQLLVFTTERFESLLQTSPEFSRSLLRQLALRIEDLYGKLAIASTNQMVDLPVSQAQSKPVLN